MKLILFTAIFCTFYSFAGLPIDWNGSIQFDTHSISNARVAKNSLGTEGTNGSQEIAISSKTAKFQSYIFKLDPTIIVNDSVSIKGEFSNGYPRGNVFGRDTKVGGGTNRSLYQVSPNGNNGINVNQLYAELYADTAVFKVGKFSKGFGLGAVFDDGRDAGDRFFTPMEGMSALFRFANFSIEPFWSKISSTSGSNDKSITEKGISANYHNLNTNLEAGLLYAVRNIDSGNSVYSTNNQAGLGNGKITLIDLYAKKSWGKFSIAAELPILSGDVGETIAGEGESDIESNSLIVHSDYELNETWKINLKAGHVKGDDASTPEFEANFLNPNYKIAKILFNYNYRAVGDSAQNIFDRSITNTNFAAIGVDYVKNSWTWNLSLITAVANETAQANKDFYHHEEGGKFTAVKDQDTSYGMELDISFDYRWNTSTTLSGYMAYFAAGDYYAFTNTAQDLELEKPFATGMSLNVSF